MAEITAADVRALRDRTGLPMMDCKKALASSDGDMERAVAWLRERNKGKLEERSGNATGEGRMFVAVSDDRSTAALVEVQCESAPVAASESLKELGDALAQEELASGVATPDELLARPAAGRGGSLREFYDDVAGKIREKIVVSRVTRVDGPVVAYVHHDGKTAVLFRADPTKPGAAADAEVMRDVAMHVAGLRPGVTSHEELDAAAVSAERTRLTDEAKKSGKPDNIVEKIVDGQLKRFYSEAGALVHQPFAKDDSKTVAQALAEKGLAAKSFVLWTLGAS